MSYDLDAFPLPPGVSADEFLESGERERLSEGDSPPSAEERAAMQGAAQALLAVDLDEPDRDAAGSIFSDISGRMDEIAASSPPQPPQPPQRRPWWKIWG